MAQWEGWASRHVSPKADIPDAHYLLRAEIGTINRAAHQSAIETALRSIDTVVELGPGSPESIAGKTLPFLAHARRYIAVDQAAHQAYGAAEQVLRATRLETEAVISDYYNPPIPKQGRGRTAFVMWGGAIGNIAGRAGSDPLPGLLSELGALAANCNPGDVVFAGIDTEDDLAKLNAAYNCALLSRKFLSVLFAAKKFGLTSGDFRPESWSHKSVWHKAARQCAHYLIAGEDQDFAIGSERLRIHAGYSVITNNSYKFTQDAIRMAARTAGFSRVVVTDDRPMALLMATR